MKISKLLLFAIFSVLTLMGCFTTHAPVYVPGANDQLLLIGAPEAHVDVTRNYFLFFGGANKRPMMADARQQLSIKYAGFVPFQFINLSVDEAKSTYFFIYNRHRLTVTANMLFKKPEFVDAAKEAISDMQNYGFVKGDKVSFSYNYYRATDGNSGILGQGVIKELTSKVVFIEVDSATRSNPIFKNYNGRSSILDVELVTKPIANFNETDVVAFRPRGFVGEPFIGEVKAFYSDYVVALVLTEVDKKRWMELGGEVELDGSIYVPTFRLFK